MRMWHYELINVLPDKQLIAQWRELCCIARNIANNGTPNHLLVNKVLNYSSSDFKKYTRYVCNAIRGRGFEISDGSIGKFLSNMFEAEEYFDNSVCCSALYAGWHNNRYLLQCFYNLQEKYDCGGITDDEWKMIQDKMNYLMIR